MAPFAIRCGIRQGCPLAPYLFLIAAEVMNAMVKVEVEVGRVKGIKLPSEDLQQVMAQYVNNTSFTLLGEEASMRYLVSTLGTFLCCIRIGDQLA